MGTITMGFYKTVAIFVLFTSVVSSTQISPKATCEECKEAFGKLVTRLLTEASLAEQMDLLKTAGWGVMASILYPTLMNPEALCNMDGVCESEDLKEWTCEDCVGGVELATGYFESEESVQIAVDLLAGDSFCGAPGATEDCAEQMAVWLPVAIPILSAALRDQEVQICQEEVGVCFV